MSELNDQDIIDCLSEDELNLEDLQSLLSQHEEEEKKEKELMAEEIPDQLLGKRQRMPECGIEKSKFKKSESKNFRLSAKMLFLTYPKCDLSLNEVYNYLNSLMEKKGIALQGHLIARELHEDGFPHIHAYLELSKKFDSKSSNCLDIEMHETIYHGNY